MEIEKMIKRKIKANSKGHLKLNTGHLRHFYQKVG